MPVRHTPPFDPVFEPLPADAMLAEFLSKLLLPRSAIEELGGAAYTLAWSVARVSTFGVLNDLREALVEIISAGGTVRDWHASLSDVYLTSGWSTSTGHALTIFRTTLATVYEGERMGTLKANPFVEWLMYDAINDSRVRPEHLAMDGAAWPAAEFPAAWWPPSGYSCRCTVIPVDQDQLATLGGRVQTGDVLLGPDGVPVYPDDGFSAPPSAEALAKDVLEDLKARLAKAGWGAVPAGYVIPKEPPADLVPTEAAAPKPKKRRRRGKR